MGENNNEVPVAMSEETKRTLLQTAKWAKITAIISFAFCLFIIATGIGRGVAGAGGNWVKAGITAIVYSGGGILLLVPTFYLYRYSAGLPEAFKNDNVSAINAALDQHRRYYRFFAITMIVIAIIYFLTSAVSGINNLL